MTPTKWTVDIWVTGWCEETGTSVHVEFDRDTQVGAVDFATTELHRMAHEVARRIASEQSE